MNPNPYHSGTVSPRRGMSGTHSVSALAAMVDKDKDSLPLPGGASSARRKRNLRLPMGLSLTTSGGPLRRWPLLIAVLVLVTLCLSLVRGGGGGRSGVVSTRPLHTPLRVDFEREMHAVDEEDTMAEDDLAAQNEVEAEPMSPEEISAQEERRKKVLATIERDKVFQLKTLVYWISRGGVFPDDWAVPTASKFAALGGDGFKTLLQTVHSADDDDVFTKGWERETDTYQRVTVFSKSYCPYSARAKELLGHYNIVPEPNVIELDQRSDMSAMQDVLQYLTGRRTVPNVLVEFSSLGGADEVTLLHHEGVLGRRVEKNPHIEALRAAEGVMPLERDELELL